MFSSWRLHSSLEMSLSSQGSGTLFCRNHTTLRTHTYMQTRHTYTSKEISFKVLKNKASKMAQQVEALVPRLSNLELGPKDT